MAGIKYTPSEFDRRLGQIITLTRNRHGLTQKDLACRLGITFQQIQKYECGANRISAKNLYELAKCFDMTVGELIDGSTCQYLHEETIQQTVALMYKMTPTQRRLILQLAAYVAS